MNSNISEEFHIISMEQQSTSSSSTGQESPLQTVSQSENTMRPQIQLPTTPIGRSESGQTLNLLEQGSSSAKGTDSGRLSSDLVVLKRPKELLENPAQPRILRVSKEDIKALCQVITEFQEQFVGF